MTSIFRPILRMFRAAPTSRLRPVAIIAIVFVFALFYSADHSLSKRNGAADGRKRTQTLTQPRHLNLSALRTSRLNRSRALASSLVPQAQGEAITTYDTDCSTPKSSFELGETVCVKATGVPATVFPWKVLFIDPAGFVERSDTAVPDDQAPYQFTLPAAATSFVNGLQIDNRGTWRINLVRSNGARRQYATISVHQSANPVADVFVQKFVRGSDATVSGGGNIPFLLIVGNAGPDSAQNVHLADALPNGATLVSFSQQSGAACTPAASNDCTIATMASGERAEFTAIYEVGGTVGTVQTSATVSSSTTELDSNNNLSTAQFEIVAGGGGSGCSLICPTSISHANDPGTAGYVIAAANFPSPITTGTCGAVSSSASPNPQTNSYFFPIGTSVITISTEAGETCNFTVTVNDTENPSITCPADITTFESSQGSGSATVNYTVTANDNSGTANVSCDHPSGDTFAVGTTAVTCTATDDSGNTSPSCSFNITVNAVNSSCSLTTQPPIVVDSDANACGKHVTYTTPTSDGTGTCGTITCDHASGSFFAVGETLVTCTSNPDGARSTFTVTVNDTTAPVPDVATLPTITSDCSATADFPTATDNCAGRISGQTQDPRTYETAGTYTVHWTYIDPSGNTSAQDQTIVITGTDTRAPVPNLATLPTVTSECSASITNPPTATDDCSGEIVGTTSDPLSYTGAGTYTVHWSYVDAVGNTSHQTQTVVVTDVHAPTIALVGANSVTVECGTTFNDPGVTTSDNCVPQNVTVTTTGSPNVNIPNSYVVTYTATDGGGNHASVQRTVTVVDTTPPTIISCAASQAVVAPSCQTAVPDFTTSVAASDGCSAVTITQSPAAGTIVGLGSTPITITVRDATGNSSTCATTFIVSSPQLTAPGPAMVWIGLKNSDDVGTKFDLLAEVLKNGVVVGSGQLNDVPGGSSGFNNAVERTVTMALSGGSAGFCSGDTMSLRLSVRVAASSGHVSGTARLWYNDSGANSRFAATINGVTATYYLRNLSGSLLLDASPGSTRLTIDVLVNRNQNGNPFKPFGTWTKTF